jgi:hypothetical protein
MLVVLRFGLVVGKDKSCKQKSNNCDPNTYFRGKNEKIAYSDKKDYVCTYIGALAAWPSD